MCCGDEKSKVDPYNDDEVCHSAYSERAADGALASTLLLAS